jgi:hypothetical protein
MSQPESDHQITTFNIEIADDSNFPIQHVNAMSIHTGSDEFFFTLGVVVPPDKEQAEAAIEAGRLVAEPIFRFAISRNSMEKFLALMAGQYDQQTKLIELINRSSEEIVKKEVSVNE